MPRSLRARLESIEAAEIAAARAEWAAVISATADWVLAEHPDDLARVVWEPGTPRPPEVDALFAEMPDDLYRRAEAAGTALERLGVEGFAA